MIIDNFGGNVRVNASAYACPRTDGELLSYLNDHRGSQIRAIGRLHSWSKVIETNGVVVDMQHFDSVYLHPSESEPVVRVGAGCQIKDVVSELQRHGWTLPTLGLIDEQSVAGAIATGTHGSGRQSLSHFVRAVRVASYSGDDGEASLDWITTDEPQRLRAARCSLGCLGVVTEIELPIREQYAIEEHFQRYATLEDVIAKEHDYPLQQFFFVPWRWDFFAQHRVETDQAKSWHAFLYRWFWSLGMDTALHVAICVLARWLPDRFTKFAYRHVIPRLIPQKWKVVDRSDRQLTMQHERFRHIEVELFVPKRHLEASLQCAREHLTAYASMVREKKYTHHYPICVRRVLPDDTFISPASAGDEPWYTLSFVSYARVSQRQGFEAFATELVRTMGEKFDARPHWGKFCPVEPESVPMLYPQWEEFAAIVQSDGGTCPFANDWLDRLLMRSEFWAGKG